MNMKKLFEKIKNYGFWVSLSASVILLINSLGNAFGFEIENQIVEDVIMSIAGVLVVFGVVTMSGKAKETNNAQESENTVVEEDDKQSVDLKNEIESVDETTGDSHDIEIEQNKE